MRNAIYKEAIQVANIADELQKKDKTLSRIAAVQQALVIFKKEKR